MLTQPADNQKAGGHCVPGEAQREVALAVTRASFGPRIAPCSEWLMYMKYGFVYMAMLYLRREDNRDVNRWEPIT